jgi:hypothetical protein
MSSIIPGPFLCFECFKPKEIIINIHRLYTDKQEAQKRIKKIKKLGYKDVAAIDLAPQHLCNTIVNDLSDI